MLKLCGFSLSNYYNKVKFALLEKGVPFVEEIARPSRDATLLERSPLGKVPYLETEQGPLCESQAIVDYLEAAYPEPRLYPADPFAAAKQRELIAVFETYVELTARELYAAAYYGGTLDEATKARVEPRLARYLDGFRRVAKFAPYVGGASFGMADVAAFVSLPPVAGATVAVYGRDLVAEAGIDWRGYVARIGERPAAQRVLADRKAYLATAADIKSPH